MTELAFIQFDGRDDAARKKERRQAVRTHVMKNFHRERKRGAAQQRISRHWEASDGWFGTAEVGRPATIASEALWLKELQAPLKESHDDRGLAARNLPDYSLVSLHADRSLVPVFHTHALVDQCEFKYNV